MESCLLQDMPYTEYKAAEALPLERCEIIARLANLRISFSNQKHPGKHLIHTLDRLGFKLNQYREFLSTALNTKLVKTFYKPHSKVAILIANDKYIHLSRLATPSMDCYSLAKHLSSLGFVTVTITNTTNEDLKKKLENIFSIIKENSYCFIFYAGHGCEIVNTKCVLSTDCPSENITENYIVTENYILNCAAKSKPELCVLIMDMCRINLDRTSNPQIYSSILSTPPITIHGNLIVAYSTSSCAQAYEFIEIECSTTMNNIETYEIKTGDTDRIVPSASQYVNALCIRLTDDLDISSMLDKVHADVEHSMKKQRPIKVQCGTDKHSLYDPAIGQTTELLNKLKEIGEDSKDTYTVF